MTNKALILVDFENEWIDKHSSEYVGKLSAVLKRTNQLIDKCRREKYKIIFIRHVEKDAKTVWAEKSNGTKIIAKLHRRPTDTLITKYKISAFFKTSLERELKGCQEIVAAGILTNLCVRSLIQDAYDRDFNITVIKDCCAAYDSKTQNFTFRDLKATRPEIKFLSLNKFI